MKKITFIAILLLCICSLTKAKEKVIEQPPFIAWTSTSIQVDKVVLSDTATVLYIKAFYHPKQWIRISGQSFLKDNNGETYALRSGNRHQARHGILDARIRRRRIPPGIPTDPGLGYFDRFFRRRQRSRCFQDMGHSAERQSPPGTFVTSRSHRT